MQCTQGCHTDQTHREAQQPLQPFYSVAATRVQIYTEPGMPSGADWMCFTIWEVVIGCKEVYQLGRF